MGEYRVWVKAGGRRVLDERAAPWGAILGPSDTYSSEVGARQRWCRYKPDQSTFPPLLEGYGRPAGPKRRRALVKIYVLFTSLVARTKWKTSGGTARGHFEKTDRPRVKSSTGHQLLAWWSFHCFFPDKPYR